jgi:hypothetical protein
MKKILIAVVAAMALGATTLATSSTADARRVGLWAHRHWDHNFWGYGSVSHGGWGLGGPADRTWVGGSMVAVTPYGPYPYGPFAHGLYP